MILRKNFLLAVCSLSLAACSGGGGGGGPTPGAAPRTKEEALQKITPEQRASFDAWSQSVIKSCDSSEAFGLGSTGGITQSGVDGAVLIKKNKNSIIFSEDKNYALLTDYVSLTGVSESKMDQSIEVNGQVSTISVETKRSGSNCEVFLFGQKVYESQIFTSFSIGTNFIKDRAVTVNSKPAIPNRLGRQGAYEVSQPGLYSLVQQSLSPSKEGLALVGKILGLTEVQTAKYFKIGSGANRTAVRLNNEPSAVWSNSQFGNLIADEIALNKYFGNQPQEINLEIRLEVPQFDFKGTKNSADNGSLSFLTSISIAKKDSDLIYSLREIKNTGLVPFNSEEALSCSKDRLLAYLGTSPGNILSPSVSVMQQSCRILHSDLDTLLYASGAYASMIATVFENIRPSSQIDYGGWDSVLSKHSKDLLAQKKNIVAELDPQVKTYIVTAISQTLELLSAELEKSKNMLVLKDSVIQMGLSWAFNNSLVSNTEISRIFRSLDNTADAFVVSTERLVFNLSRNPHAYQDQLTFAQNVDQQYKSEALRALNLSKELSYKEFESDIYSQILQLQTPIAELTDWSARLTTIKNEINKFPALGAAKGTLVKHSLKWLKNGERTVENISEIYSAINNAMDPFSESTLKLVETLGESLGGSLESLNFAKSITPEYKRLALAIRENSRVSNYESWGKNFFATVLQAKPSIELVRQYNDLWLSVIAFEQREKTRIAGEPSSMPKWNREKVIAKAVKEIWSGEDFASLEAIAAVAVEKNTCSRNKDFSSLAECAGLDNFSKSEEKFLFPGYQGRYKQLGVDLNAFMRRVPGPEWTTFKWSIVNALFDTWNPLWSKCDNSAFSARANELKALLNAIAVEKDQFKKWDLERKIKSSFDNCR